MPPNRQFLTISVFILIAGCYSCAYLLYAAYIAIFGPWALTPFSICLNRVGILLQLIAGVSALPDFVGKEQLSKWYKHLQQVHLKVKAGKYRTGLTLFALLFCMVYIFMNVWVFAGGHGFNTLTFVIVLLIGVSVILVTVAPDESTPPVLLSIGLVRVLSWTIKQGSMRRLISRISFPIFMLGTFLQLLSTFIP